MVTLCTCDTEEGHDGAMGVVSPALLPHQGLDPQPPRQSSSAGHHHHFFLIPSPQTVILGSRAASAAALVLCSPVSQLCIDTLVGAAAALLSTVGLLSRLLHHLAELNSLHIHIKVSSARVKGGIHPYPASCVASYPASDLGVQQDPYPPIHVTIQKSNDERCRNV